MKDLRQSIREMGRGEVKLEDVDELSNFQLKETLKSCEGILGAGDEREAEAGSAKDDCGQGQQGSKEDGH